MALTLIRHDAVRSLTDVFPSFLHLPRCKIAFSGLYLKKKSEMQISLNLTLRRLCHFDISRRLLVQLHLVAIRFLASRR